MDIFDFYTLSVPIMKTLPKKKLESFSKAKKNADIEAVVLCYRQIFNEKILHQRLKYSLVNDTFTDFQTQVRLHDPGTIIVTEGTQSYAFTPEEIVDIMHGNLDSSTAEYEPQFGICTLTKTFSLPKNPWTQKIFSKAQMKNILSQMIIQRKTKLLLKFPEVMVFALTYEKFNYLKNMFDMSGDIIDVFKQHGLRYEEKIWYDTVKKFCQNGSKWIFSSKKKISESDYEKKIFENS